MKTLTRDELKHQTQYLLNHGDDAQVKTGPPPGRDPSLKIIFIMLAPKYFYPNHSRRDGCGRFGFTRASRRPR